MASNAHVVNRHKKYRKKQLDEKIRIIDKLCTVFAILMPATSVPQAVQIYATQDVSGISLTTWLLYITALIPFLLYGIIHKEKQIILLNICWLVISLIIIVGIFLYK